MVVAIVVLLIVVAVSAVVVVMKRRSPTTEQAQPEPTGPTPMTGLESALSQVTDSTGHTLGERLDDETGHVDELRVVDDTGPLLRRALDHVADDDETPPDR